MTFAVNQVADFNDSFASATGGSLGNTGALTAGRKLLLIARLRHDTGAISSLTVGGVSATAIPGATVANGNYRWTAYTLTVSGSGAQGCSIAFDAGTDFTIGVWAAELTTDVGTLTVGAVKGTVTTGDDSITTTEANSLLLAFARDGYNDPVADNLGGGTIVQATMANTYNLNGGAWTLDAGAVGSKTISWTQPINEVLSLEFTTGSGGGDTLMPQAVF